MDTHDIQIHANDSGRVDAQPALLDRALYAYYMAGAVENLPDLISAFESRQLSILPIVMPDPDFIHLQDGGLLPFDPGEFPSRLVRRLIPVDDNGVTVYPVTIMEVPGSGERQVLNAAGDVIAEIRAPKGYDPLWYVRLRFPDLDALDAETAAWQVALYDPSRIMVRFRLITGDELVRKVMAESLAATQSLTFAPLALSYPANGLAFDSLSVQTNGTVDVSIVWPSGTLASEGLDIFACSNLMEPQWQILLTTNVNNAAGSFDFSAPAAGDGEKRFLDAWTHYDGDGDELYDGREVRLYGTDRYNADTDGDGMPDGWELQHGFDPLNPDDALADADSDGLTNLGEYQAGTDPHNSDTDGDGIPDGAEVGGTSLVAWGGDWAGQCSGAASITGAVAIAAGGEHSLALFADGSISAWGNDTAGQVSGAASVSNAIAIAAGLNHSLALFADGTVAAWGNDTAGQVSGASQIAGAVALSASSTHSLALLGDGTVAAWGDDTYGKCSGAASITGAVAVAAGWVHSLALLSDGTIVSWGYACPCGAWTSITGAVAIAAGPNHSLALLSDGTVVAWGDDSDGQVSGASQIRGAVAIDASVNHSLALIADGSVVAWGGNSQGQVDIPPATVAVKAVSAGGWHFNLALRASTDPLKPDTDGDGLLDGHDLTVDASDPRYAAFAAADIAHTDSGGLRTFMGEADAGCDPLNWSTAGTGIPDGWLVRHGFDPLDPAAAAADPDQDGLSNYLEMIYGTAPNLADTDGDGTPDLAEIVAGNDPLAGGSTNHPYGAAMLLASLGYEPPTVNGGEGGGRGVLQIGPVSIPFSRALPVQQIEVWLPKGIKHPMSLGGDADNRGGPVAMSFQAPGDTLLLHDPEGLLGPPHAPADPPFPYVAFPVLTLGGAVSGAEYQIQWPDNVTATGCIIPAGVPGFFQYSGDNLTFAPPTSTNGVTVLGLESLVCGSHLLSLSYYLYTNSLSVIGSRMLYTTATVIPTPPDLDIQAFILDHQLSSAGELRIAKWENAYASDTALHANFIDAEPDRFYIQVHDESKEGEATVTATVRAGSAPVREIILDAVPGSTCTFRSQALLLVSNPVDDELSGSGLSILSTRTVQASLGDEVVVEYTPSVYCIPAETARADVNACGAITVNIVNLIVNGSPCGDADVIATVTNWTTAAYAQVGVKVNFTYHTMEPPPGVDLSEGLKTVVKVTQGDRNDHTFRTINFQLTSDYTNVLSFVRSCTGAESMNVMIVPSIRVVTRHRQNSKAPWIEAVSRNDPGFGLFPSHRMWFLYEGSPSHIFNYLNNMGISINASTHGLRTQAPGPNLSIVAHELGHVLTNDEHPLADSPEAKLYNIMQPGLPTYEASENVFSRKRFTGSQATVITNRISVMGW